MDREGRLWAGLTLNTDHKRKLVVSLSLAAKAVMLSNHFKASGRAIELRPFLNLAVDRLLADLLANYEGAVCVRDLGHAFDSINEMAFDQLAGYCQGVIPVTIMRGLLHVHNLEFEVDNTPHWRLFSARYGTLLMQQPRDS